MRISDRSSDVCSSGLVRQEGDTRDGADNTCEIEDDADARAIEQAGALDGKSKDRDLKEPKAKPRERRSNPDLFSSPVGRQIPAEPGRSEEHTSELQSLMSISYAVFCLKKKTTQN